VVPCQPEQLKKKFVRPPPHQKDLSVVAHVCHPSNYGKFGITIQADLGEKKSEPVPHACNPSYSKVRDQKDCGLKPTQANTSRDPISKKKPSQKRLAKWLKV
jgi:hypothetical protein